MIAIKRKKNGCTDTEKNEKRKLQADRAGVFGRLIDRVALIKRGTVHRFEFHFNFMPGMSNGKAFH